MRIERSFRSATVALVILTAALAAFGCSSSEPTNEGDESASKSNAPPSGKSPQTPNQPANGSLGTPPNGASPSPPADAGLPPASSGSCNIADPGGAATVSLSFEALNGAPPALAGGKLANTTWKATAIKVLIPQALAGVVRINQSKGTASAWAVFREKDFRLLGTVDASLSTTIAGTQALKTSLEQGGDYQTSGGALNPTSECPGVKPDAGVDLDFKLTYSRSGTTGQILATASMAGQTIYVLFVCSVTET